MGNLDTFFSSYSLEPADVGRRVETISREVQAHVVFTCNVVRCIRIYDIGRTGLLGRRKDKAHLCALFACFIFTTYTRHTYLYSEPIRDQVPDLG